VNVRARITALAIAAILAAPIGARADTKEAGQFVDLAPVSMPVIVDGKLINYVFVYVRIDLTSGADMPKWRDKEPYFRDALVRAGYRTPFTRFDDYTQIDEAKLKATLFQLAQQITGPGAVAAIEILPGGGPMRRAGLPKPKLAAH
jgi:hypothetical protein